MEKDAVPSGTNLTSFEDHTLKYIRQHTQRIKSNELSNDSKYDLLQFSRWLEISGISGCHEDGTFIIQPYVKTNPYRSQLDGLKTNQEIQEYFQQLTRYDDISPFRLLLNQFYFTEYNFTLSILYSRDESLTRNGIFSWLDMIRVIKDVRLALSTSEFEPLIEKACTFLNFKKEDIQEGLLKKITLASDGFICPILSYCASILNIARLLARWDSALSRKMLTELIDISVYLNSITKLGDKSDVGSLLKEGSEGGSSEKTSEQFEPLIPTQAIKRMILILQEM